MARRKLITKEQILKGAYDFIAQEGFQHFTARNIASHIGCSTQPIYLEFESMEELKEAIFGKVEEELEAKIFLTVRTGDSVVDMGLNYIEFAMSENRLYKTLFTENYGGGDRMHQFSYRMFVKRLLADEKYNNLTSQQMKVLHTGTWIVVTGLASLMSSKIISPTEEQIIAIIKDSFTTLKDKDSILA